MHHFWWSIAYKARLCKAMHYRFTYFFVARTYKYLTKTSFVRHTHVLFLQSGALYDAPKPRSLHCIALLCAFGMLCGFGLRLLTLRLAKRSFAWRKASPCVAPCKAELCMAHPLSKLRFAWGSRALYAKRCITSGPPPAYKAPLCKKVKGDALLCFALHTKLVQSGAL